MGLFIIFFGFFGVGVLPEGKALYEVRVLYTSIGSAHSVVAIPALLGGINATKRRRWSIAVSGVVASVLISLPLAIWSTVVATIYWPVIFISLGIAAMILTALSKDEFE